MLGCLFIGCTAKKAPVKKIKDLDFTVCKDENLPKELAALIEEKKKMPFKLTYSTKEYLYIVTGYGEQTMGGYQIQVDDLYLTENAVYVNTTLTGPQEKAELGASYPYIVLKTEYCDVPVVFQ